MTLIGADDGSALWAALLALVAFGLWCERRPWGRRLSGVLIVITVAIVLANLRVLPFEAPVYAVVWGDLVPVAVALLLLRADLRRIVREAGPLLLAFAVGAASVAGAALLTSMVIDLGADEAALVGVFTASYIGGSLNFAGTVDATGFSDGALLSAAVAADNIVTNLHFLALLALPSLGFVARAFAAPELGQAMNADTDTDTGAAKLVHREADVDVPALIAALALAFGLVALADALANWLGAPSYAILLVTLFAVAFGTLQPALAARLTGAEAAGNVLLLLFLATIGATADVGAMLADAPILCLFALIVVAGHTAALLIVGRLLGLGLSECLVASAACIGGPASAVALATSRGWRALVTPAVLAGSLGYATGTFFGVFVASALT